MTCISQVIWWDPSTLEEIFSIDNSCDVVLVAFEIFFLVRVVLGLGLWLLLQVGLGVGFAPYKRSGAQHIVRYTKGKGISLFSHSFVR
jgi:hypothetical protein